MSVGRAKHCPPHRRELSLPDYTTEWLESTIVSRQYESEQQPGPDEWTKIHQTHEQSCQVPSDSLLNTSTKFSIEALTPPSDLSSDSQSETSNPSTWQSSATSYSNDGSSEEEDFDGTTHNLVQNLSTREPSHGRIQRQIESLKDIDFVPAVAPKSETNTSPDAFFKIPTAQREAGSGYQCAAKHFQAQQRCHNQSAGASQPLGGQNLNRRRSGCHQNAVAPPCKLRRDTESSDCFVTLLIIFATRLITAIWPLSACPPMMSTSFNNGAGVLPLRVFIQETLRRSKTSYSTLQVALYYLILLKDKLPDCDFTREQSSSYPSEDGQPAGKPSCRAMQCGRRMFLAALMLASKYLQDRNYSTRAWSKISGLRSIEINENEMQYLSSIDYNLHMSKDSFENWSRLVLTLSKLSKLEPTSQQDGLLCFQGRHDNANNDFVTDLEKSDGSTDEPQLYTDQWWTKVLRQIQPDVVKDVGKTDTFLMRHVPTPEATETLARMHDSLSNPQNSPKLHQGYRPDMTFSDALPSRVVNVKPPTSQSCQSYESPAQTTTLPLRPQLRNLPTPQSTPRVSEVCPSSNGFGKPTLRCSASMDVLRFMRKQSIMNANLERCPPPRPASFYLPAHNLVRPAASNLDCSSRSTTPSVLSPLSVISESTCPRSRSRSSSISSNSSWSSLASDRKRLVQFTQDLQFSSPLANTMAVSDPLSEPPARAVTDISGIRYSANASSFRETPMSSTSVAENCAAREGHILAPVVKRFGSQTEAEAIQALMSLSAFDHTREDNRVLHNKKSTVSLCSQISSQNSSPIAGHKRSFSRTKDALHLRVRESLTFDNVGNVAMEDPSLSTHEHVRAKQLQLPSKQWAAAKKPVPSLTDNKRVAMQFAIHEYNSAPNLAAQYLTDPVTVA